MTGGSHPASGRRGSFRTRLAIALLGGIFLVIFIVPVRLAKRRAVNAAACRERLRTFDEAVKRWAAREHKDPGAKPSRADLAGYPSALTHCPLGPPYVPGTSSSHPRCPSRLPGHSLEKPKPDQAGKGR